MKLSKEEVIIKALQEAIDHVEAESSIFLNRRFRSICATDLSPSGMEKFFDENDIPKTAICFQEDDGLWFNWVENTYSTEKQQTFLKIESFQGYSYMTIHKMMFENGYKINKDRKRKIKLTRQSFYDMYVGGQHDRLVEYYYNDFV